MGLYKREDLENDLRELDSIRASANRALLAKRIDGFKYTKIRNMLDAAEEGFRGKLLGTMFMLNDAAAARKNTVQVMQNHDGTMVRKSAGKWEPVTEAQLRTLEDAGQKLVEIRSRKARDTQDPTEFVPKWRKVSREEGRRLSSEGHSVKFGEGDSAEVIVR